MRASLAAFLLIAVCTGQSQAFLIQTFAGEDAPIQQTWSNPERIPFVLYGTGSDDLSPEESHRLIRESFQIWQDVPTSRVAFIDQGETTTRTPSRRDRRNLIFFDEANAYLQAPRGSGIIAVTRLNSNALTGEITDADIIFNGLEFTFAGDNSSTRGSVNLKDVAVHEVGHLLGLEHTPLDGPAISRPTMNPFNRGDGPGLGQSLEADDIAGVSYLYPTANYARTVGKIKGTVRDLQGNGLFGAHLIAYNVDTGVQISTVSGAFDGSSGSYVLEGLPPGSYRLELAAIGGAINEDNFGGIFTDFAAGFPREFYDNSRAENLAQLVNIEAGQTLDSIDFTTGFIRPGFPSIELLALPSNTPDTSGPYTIRAQAINVNDIWLHYRRSDEQSQRIAMQPVGEDLFTAPIPGQPTHTRLEFRFEARNDSIEQSFFPENGSWFGFSVVELSGAPLAFTALRDADVVSVIDTETSNELARIAVGDEPIQLILSQDGRSLYVSNLSSNDISVISTATFQEIERIPTALQPLDLALSPDGKTLYATNSGAGTLTVVDLATNAGQTVWIAGLSTGPYGIAARNDKVFVTDLANDQLLIMTPSGTVQSRIDVAAQPRSLALSPDSRSLYIASMGEGTLTVFNAEEERISQRVELPVEGTFAVAAHPAGEKVYLTAHDDGSVLVLNSADMTLRKQIFTGDNPRGLSFSPDGQIVFVTNAFSDRITLLDGTTDETIGTYSTSDQPRGIAVSNPVYLSADTSVSAASSLPEGFTLHPTYPNPFNAETQIAYSLPMDIPRQRVQLNVYNGMGQRVRQLVNAVQEPGFYATRWDGRDDRGKAVSTGVYMLSLRTDGHHQTRKLLLLR